MAARADSISSEAREASSFYFYMAVAFAVIAFAGFARTYVIPVATNSFTGSAMVHVHGLLFLGWTILFAVQARLVERRRVDLHRALGLLGISFATAMLFMGVALVVRGLEYGVAAGNAAAAQMLAIIPLSQITLFVAFFAAAIANLRRPETHKRLMMLATVNLLQAAIARFFLMVIAPETALPNFGATPVEDVRMALTVVAIPAALIDLLVVAALVRDWRRTGRPHRAYVIGLACMIFVQAVRAPLAQTELWRSIAGGIAALAA